MVFSLNNEFYYTFILDSTFCLRDLLLSLPPAVSLRDTIGLNCTYHLQGEELYTINLYKGRHEFLQYMPERVPPLKQFHRKGINIQVLRLNEDGLPQNHVLYVQIIRNFLYLFAFVFST